VRQVFQNYRQNYTTSYWKSDGDEFQHSIKQLLKLLHCEQCLRGT